MALYNRLEDAHRFVEALNACLCWPRRAETGDCGGVNRHGAEADDRRVSPNHTTSPRADALCSDRTDPEELAEGDVAHAIAYALNQRAGGVLRIRVEVVFESLAQLCRQALASLVALVREDDELVLQRATSKVGDLRAGPADVSRTTQVSESAS